MGGPKQIGAQHITGTSADVPDSKIDRHATETANGALLTAGELTFTNLDGAELHIKIDSLRHILPGSKEYPVDTDMKLVQLGWLIRDNLGSQILVTHDGFLYGHKCPNSNHPYVKINPKALTFNASGVPLAEDGSEMSPRARIISLGDGILFCAPPNIEVTKDQAIPMAGWKKALAEFIGIKSAPDLATCKVEMSGSMHLSSGPGGCIGSADDSYYKDWVKITINPEGRVLLDKKTEASPNNFKWEADLETIIVDTQAEFDRRKYRP
jgi:hypothetical protein